MRTSVLVLDPKARRNLPLAPTEEVRTLTRSSHYGTLTHYEIRDLSFLLFLQEDRTVFTSHQGIADDLRGLFHC
jgi:hypothetical protein